MAALPARTLQLVILFTFALGGSVRPSVPTAQRLGLAVLNFESQSPDTNDAYLADEIVEEVIPTLAGVTRLQGQ